MAIKLSQVIQNLIKDPELTPEQKKQEIEDLLAKAHTIPEIEDDRINNVGMGVSGEAATVGEPGLLESGVKETAGVIGDFGIGAGKNLGKIANKLFPNRESISRKNAPASSLRFGNTGGMSSVSRSNTPEEEAALQPEGIAQNLGSMASDMALLQGSPIGAGVKAAIKGEGLLASAIKAALTGAGETAGLNAVKGQGTTEGELLTSGGVGGVLGAATKGAGKLSEKYISHLLKQGNDQARPEVIKDMLNKVLSTDPVQTVDNPSTLSGTMSNVMAKLRGPVPKPLSRVVEGVEGEANQLAQEAIPLALPVNRLKNDVKKIANKGLLGAYDPALVAGKPSGLSVRTLDGIQEGNFKALDPNFRDSGKSFIETIQDVLNMNNPKEIIIPPTFAKPKEQTIREFINPRTNQKVPTGLVNPNLVNDASLVSILIGLEDKIPNALRTPRSLPENDFINNLREMLTRENLPLSRTLAKRAAKQEGLVALQGLVNKAKVGGNDAVGAGKVVSGLQAGKLPYTAAAAASISNPANAARNINAGSKQFEEMILPQILKAIAATTAAKPLQGRQ